MTFKWIHLNCQATKCVYQSKINIQQKNLNTNCGKN